MKKRILLVLIALSLFKAFAQDISFKLSRDVFAKGGNIDSQAVFLEKGTLLDFYSESSFFNLDKELKYSISLQYENEFLDISGNDLLFTDYPNYEIESKNSYWCMAYYYDALKSRNFNLINNNDVITPADREDSLMFQPLYFMLGNCYIAGQSSALFGDFNAISRIESKTEDEIVFVIMFKDCGIKDIEQTFMWDKHYKRLYESRTPYKVIFKIDGDYADVYINSVGNSNFLFTLARTDKNTLNQITSFVKTGEFDSSEISWPKRGNELGATSSTNIVPNKVMTAFENLKLRSGEATSTQVLSIMAAGTKVKILEIGKAETIDGINSNWVKVEIISGKDRNGNIIRSGTTGWCYGGYLE